MHTRSPAESVFRPGDRLPSARFSRLGPPAGGRDRCNSKIPSRSIRERRGPTHSMRRPVARRRARRSTRRHAPLDEREACDPAARPATERSPVRSPRTDSTRRRPAITEPTPIVVILCSVRGDMYVTLGRRTCHPSPLGCGGWLIAAVRRRKRCSAGRVRCRDRPSPIHHVRDGDPVRRSSVRSSAPLATGGGRPSRARGKEAVYKSSGNDGPARKRGINVGSGIGYTHGEVT